LYNTKKRLYHFFVNEAFFQPECARPNVVNVKRNRLKAIYMSAKKHQIQLAKYNAHI